ncbi:hypothetical protein AB0G06_36610 [Nonomuraea dietziae]|uniref:hypothetical protein n=1 Tax=Nonomuraea dietziae TaxID=65515 RepID=UPI0033D0F5A8
MVADRHGGARLWRDLTDTGTGASRVGQDSRERPQATHWVSGTAGGNTAAALLDRTRVTATLG